MRIGRSDLSQSRAAFANLMAAINQNLFGAIYPAALLWHRLKVMSG